jgi:hypothetical protein
VLKQKTAFIHERALLAQRVAQNLDGSRLTGCPHDPVTKLPRSSGHGLQGVKIITTSQSLGALCSWSR